MTRAALALVLALAAGPLWSQNPDPGGRVVVVSPAGDGSGVTAYISDMTLEEAGILLGTDPPPGTTAVIIDDDGIRFTDVPIDELDRENGGDGHVVYDLFPEGAGPIQPRDGTWQSKAVSLTHSGCPAALGAQLDGIGTRFEQVLDVSMSVPFRPGESFPDLARFTWHRLGPNTWRSQLFDMAADLGAPGGMAFNVIWVMNVRDEETIRNDGTIDLILPAAMAAMLGGGADCHVDLTVDYVRR